MTTESWPPDGRPSFETLVGHSGWDEHLFMGHRVFEELLGQQSWTQLIALSILGRTLSEHELRVARRVAEVQTLADPRIPPLWVARMVATEGRALTGVACGMMACDKGVIGPGVAERCAQMFLELDAALKEPEDAAAVGRWLAERKAAKRGVPGFGIPFRGRDERIVAITRAMKAEGHEGRYWRWCLLLQEVAEDAIGIPPNIILAYASLCLDLGFDTEGAGLFANMCTMHCFTANAYEGMKQRDEVMRRLPDDWVEYRGQAPRRSPRAGG